MREFEFRGRMSNGKWVYGNLLLNCISDIVCIGSGDKAYAVDPDTVGQYTGLKDIHGYKIFEGDILRCRDEYYMVDYLIGDYNGWIFRDTSHLSFFIQFSEHTVSWSRSGVVGNRYDNPELLRGEYTC